MTLIDFMLEPVRIINKLVNAIFKFTREHKELTVLLFLTFLMRLFLAGWNSYWLDELYSVYRLMLLATPEPVKIQSAYELISHYYLAGNDYPLYDFLLYNWMEVFGTTEVATRALSSIYVSLATAFLYLTAYRLYNRRIAICSALFFNLSYMAVYYSLEARYYAQTLFLSTLSSYFLVSYLESIETKLNWKTLIINKYYTILLLVNFAFLLTFTFNFLFFAAQGLFVLFYFLYKDNTGSKLKSIFHVIIIYAIQIVVMFALWFHAGIRGIFRKYDQFGGINDEINHTFFNSFKSPSLILYENVVKPNFSLPLAVMLIILLIFSMFCIKQIIKLYKKDSNSISIRRALYLIYFFLLTFLPSLFVYFIFSIGGFEKLTPRYLIYSVPPLMILLALTLEQFVIVMDKMLRLFKTKVFLRHYIQHATIYAIIVTTILVLPGGYNAATRRKDDWRGIASQIVQQVHKNPDSSYYIVETTWRRFPMMDFYFNKYSDKVQVSGIIQRFEEGRMISEEGYTPNLLRADNIRIIEEHDYLILAFSHHSISQFTLFVDLLSEEYELLHSSLDVRGRGYLLFNTAPNLKYAEYKDSMIDGGLSFGGDSSFIDLEFSPDFSANESFTFELWFKPLENINASFTLFGPFENQATAYGLHAFHKNRVSFGVRTEDDIARVDYTGYRLNVWYHLAGVYDGEEQRVYLYVDGKLVDTAILEGFATALSNENFGFNLPATIHGSVSEIGSNHYVIREARLWDVARSQSHIRENMFVKLDENESNLIGYWPLDEGEGNIVHDLSVYGNHGIIHGTPLWAENLSSN